MTHNPVVNLNKKRKEKTRAQKKARADENAVKFGRTKAERLLLATKESRANTVLDQHKFEDE